MSDAAQDYCFGHQAAMELLEAALTILSSSETQDGTFSRIALKSVDNARKWLKMCADCRQRRLKGEAPLCGPITD